MPTCSEGSERIAHNRIYPWDYLQGTPGLQAFEERRPGEPLEDGTRNRIRASGTAWCKRNCPELRVATSIDHDEDGVWYWLTDEDYEWGTTYG